ncbi:peptide/nickel transport system substrate-binding protein [Nakamurella sp. UYEF19]|uniref:ABC transporter substrate-binding protein n=1 Tax=Nakamurella sp. UYEF19 TaxID=1756392 RepID=UPI00339324FB
MFLLRLPLRAQAPPRTSFARRRRPTLVVALTVAALSLAACSGGSSTTAIAVTSDPTAAAPSGVAGSAGSAGSAAPAAVVATKANTLVAYTGQSGDYQINFNPYSPSSIGGIGTIYESLFFVTNVNSNKPTPLLGTDYTWNTAGTELKVTLRSGVTWSDGTPFTSADVLFTFNLLLKTASLNTSGFDGKVSAPDATHIVINWSHPAFVSGPAVLGSTYILPEHIWKGLDPTTELNKTPVGTGPFVLSNFKPQAYTITANPKYWGGEPKVKAIRFLSLSGNTAGADALAAGTVDWQTGPVPDIAKVAEIYPGYQAITIPQNQVVLGACSSVAMGCKGPQTDPAVRQAIYYAMDRTQVNSLAFQNTSSEMSSTFALPFSQKDQISKAITDPMVPMTPDVAKSDSILTAAGYVKGADGIYAKGGVKLSLTVAVVSGWTDYITALDTMTQQLKAAGIAVLTSQSSWNDWTDKKAKGSFQLAIDSLGQGRNSDPYWVYNNYFTTAGTAKVDGKTAAGNNFARYSDPTVDAAVKTLAATAPTDAAARQTQFDIIQKAIVANMPYIPVMTGGTTSEYNAKKFTGWPTKEDLYAFPAIWASPDNAQIYKNLVPTSN